MREVAVVAFASAVVDRTDKSEVEILAPVISEIKERTGLRRFGFTCSGSLDYLAGTPFSFVSALDAVGAWPPISESHVEMDAAWALYEAWVRLQHGDVDTALVYGFGKPSQADVHKVMTTQLDPYYLAPLGVDQLSLAGLHANASGYAGEPGGGRGLVEAPFADGAVAVVLATGDSAGGGMAGALHERPAWITGIDHRAEAHQLGARDLSASESARIAAEKAGVRHGRVDAVELHAQFSHEVPILRRALGVDGGRLLESNPVMATGLIRIGEAAGLIHEGASRTVAHATSGPCLQQNLVCVLEA